MNSVIFGVAIIIVVTLLLIFSELFIKDLSHDSNSELNFIFQVILIIAMINAIDLIIGPTTINRFIYQVLLFVGALAYLSFVDVVIREKIRGKSRRFINFSKIMRRKGSNDG